MTLLNSNLSDLKSEATQFSFFRQCGKPEGLMRIQAGGGAKRNPCLEFANI